MEKKSSMAEIEQILARAKVMHLAIHDTPAPYVVPLFFGYEPGRLYVHSGPTGTKIRLLSANPHVGFSATAPVEIIGDKTPCSSTARAASVAGTGIARIVKEEKERLHGLDLIVRHSTAAEPPFTYDPASLAKTLVIAIDIVAILGRGTENRRDARTPSASVSK